MASECAARAGPTGGAMRTCKKGALGAILPYLRVATTERHAEGPRGAEVRAHARLTRPRVLLKQNAEKRASARERRQGRFRDNKQRS